MEEFAWLDEAGDPAIFLCGVILFAAATEVSYFLGRRLSVRQAEQVETQVVTLQSAALGLLALMLGFTFALALDKFHERRTLVLEEASAVGKTALRAGLLSDPMAAEVKPLLLAYLQARLAVHSDVAEARELTDDTRRSKELQGRLWRVAEAASRDPRSVPAGLFAQSVNEVIDLQERRLAAIHNPVPGGAFLLLYAIAVVAMGFTGYACALIARPHRVPNAITAVLLSAILVLIVDLGRPNRGLLVVSQQPLIDMRHEIEQSQD